MAHKKLYKEVTVTSAQTAKTPATQRMYRGLSTVNPDNTTFSLNDIGLIKQDLLNHFHISQGEKLENFKVAKALGIKVESKVEDEVKDFAYERRVISVAVTRKKKTATDAIGNTSKGIFP